MTQDKMADGDKLIGGVKPHACASCYLPMKKQGQLEAYFPAKKGKEGVAVSRSDESDLGLTVESVDSPSQLVSEPVSQPRSTQ